MRTLCGVCEGAADEAALCAPSDEKVKDHTRDISSRQKIEFLEEKPGHCEDLMLQGNHDNDHKLEHKSLVYKKRLLEHVREKMDKCRMPPISISQLDINHDRLDPTMIDLNARPHRIPDQVTNSSQAVLIVVLGFELFCLVISFLLDNPGIYLNSAQECSFSSNFRIRA